MRTITSLSVFLFLCFTGFSQEKLQVKQGQQYRYSVSVNGQTFPMFARIDSLTAAYCGIVWSFDESQSGRFVMEKQSLEEATHAHWKQPVVGEELVLPPDQSVLMLSRKLFATLVENKKGVFDQYNVIVKPTTSENEFKLEGKKIDALYLEGDAGTKIWILNDPQTPLILKIEGNPYRVNIQVESVR